MTAIESLAEAFRQGPGQVALNSKFLARYGTNPPPGFDAALSAAFGLEAPEPALSLTYPPGRVSPVVDDAFSVPGAGLSFYGYPPADSDVSLRFAEAKAPLRVTIEVGLGGDWTWTTTFNAMKGAPFDLLTYADPTFVFSTDPIEKFPWEGGAIDLEQGLNFAAEIEPSPFGPTFGLLKGVKLPVKLVLAGPIDVSETEYRSGPEGRRELPYPTMDLRALVAAGKFKAVGDYITVSDPRIGFRVEAAEVSEGEDGLPLLLPGGEPTTETQQNAWAFVAADLEVGKVRLELETPLGEGTFGLAIAVADDSPEG